MNFNGIKNLSDKKTVEGLKMCFNNSNELFESALLLGKNEKYGIGISVAILSSDELIKAIALFGMLFSPDKSVMKPVFKGGNLHENRYRVALEGTELFDIIDKMNINPEKIDFKGNFDELIKSFAEKVDINSIMVNMMNTENANTEWFDNANSMKNNGIYVSYNVKWEHPKRYKKKDFDVVIDNISVLRSRILKMLNGLLEAEKTGRKIEYIEIYRGLYEKYMSEMGASPIAQG